MPVGALVLRLDPRHAEEVQRVLEHDPEVVVGLRVGDRLPVVLTASGDPAEVTRRVTATTGVLGYELLERE